MEPPRSPVEDKQGQYSNQTNTTPRCGGGDGGADADGITIVDRTGYPVLSLDAESYRSYVAEYGLSPEQEEELIRTLWTMIVQFVDLGFGIETTQNALAVRGGCKATSQADHDSDRKGGTQ